MQNNASSFSDEKKEKAQESLARWYKYLFVPYAALFIPYVILSIGAGSAAFYFGIPADYIKYIYLPSIVALSACYFLFRTIQRWKNNRAARKKSLNPSVKILEESNGLHFKQNDVVEYCVDMLIKSIRSEISNMTLFLEWHGDVNDTKIIYQSGCCVVIQKAKETSGVNLIISLNRNIMKNRKYPISFIIQFNNHNKLIRPFLRKVQPYLPEVKFVQFLKFDDNEPMRFVEATYSAGNVERASDEKYITAYGGYHVLEIPYPAQGKSYKIASQESS